MSTSLSHLGLCVSDLERSLRFHCDGLGFERGVGTGSRASSSSLPTPMACASS
jgi:catechol 2,3-dioxygenase-like lactoylglutathione lyase family enzyme